jgi:hypothetical protein
MIDATVQVPNGWLVGDDPPAGVGLVAVEPTTNGAVRANLVVTMIARPAYDDVNAYLDDVLASLLTDLDGASLLDAWTTDRPDAVPPTLGQRIVLEHRLGDATATLVQEHTWIDDTIVVVTVTVRPDAPDDVVDMLARCLTPEATAA